MSDLNMKVSETDSSTQNSFRNGQLHTKKFPKWTAPHKIVSEMDSSTHESFRNGQQKKKFFFVGKMNFFFFFLKKLFASEQLFFSRIKLLW